MNVFMHPLSKGTQSKPPTCADKLCTIEAVRLRPLSPGRAVED
jgi:hypothetical protein